MTGAIEVVMTAFPAALGGVVAGLGAGMYYARTHVQRCIALEQALRWIAYAPDGTPIQAMRHKARGALWTAPGGQFAVLPAPRAQQS